MFQESAECDEHSRIPLHNVDENREHHNGQGEASQGESAEPGSSQERKWGERDVGGHVNFLDAVHGRRNELSHLSKTWIQRTEEGRRNTLLGLRKTIEIYEKDTYEESSKMLEESLINSRERTSINTIADPETHREKCVRFQSQWFCQCTHRHQY